MKPNAFDPQPNTRLFLPLGRIHSVLRRVFEVPAVHCRQHPPKLREALESFKFKDWTGQQAPAAPDYEHYLNVPKFTSGGKDAQHTHRIARLAHALSLALQDVPQDFQHMAEPGTLVCLCRCSLHKS